MHNSESGCASLWIGLWNIIKSQIYHFTNLEKLLLKLKILNSVLQIVAAFFSSIWGRMSSREHTDVYRFKCKNETAFCLQVCL